MTWDADLTIDGSTIIFNSAGEAGGGVYARGDSNLRIQNNTDISFNSADQDGGGVLLYDIYTATITNSTIRENQAASGGGIHALRDHYPPLDLTIIGSTISGNEAASTSAGGGGLLVNRTDLVLDNSTVKENIAHVGGGIFAHNSGSATGSVSITNTSRIALNYAAYIGGGIYANNIQPLTISNSSFLSNSAGAGGGLLLYNTQTIINASVISNNLAGNGNGGGIEMRYNTVEITDSLLYDNRATDYGGVGGGVFVNAATTLRVDRATLVANEGYAGGGIYNADGVVSVTNTTLSGNIVRITLGGALENQSLGTMYLKNVTVWDTLGHGISNAGTISAANTIVGASNLSNCYGTPPLNDPGYNISSDDSCGFDISNTDALLNDLTYSANERTAWHMPKLDSPALDAGNNTVCNNSPVNNVDQRGVARPLDGDNDGTATCDIGAVERDIALPQIGITPTHANIAEGDVGDQHRVKLTFERTGAMDGTSSVTFTVNEFSVDSDDYFISPSDLTITFASGETIKTVDVVVIGDAEVEPDEELRIELVSAEKATLEPDFLVSIITIENDDSPEVLFSRTELTVSEPDTTADTGMRLSEMLHGELDVTLSTTSDECVLNDGTPHGFSTSHVFTFDPISWEEGLTVRVRAVDDLVEDGTQICLITGEITRIEDPQDQSTYGFIAPEDIDDLIVSVRDNEGGYEITPPSLIITEPDGTGDFEFRLATIPAATVNVQVGIPSSGGTWECEFYAVGSYVEPDGFVSHIMQLNDDQPVQLTVQAVDGDLVDGDQTCRVEFLVWSSDPNYDGMLVDDYLITVQDDDSAAIMVAPTSLSIAEPAGTGSFNIHLNKSPGTETVTVGLSTANGECDLGGVTEAILTDANWDSGVDVTVTAVDDALVDGTQPCLVETAPAVSGDAAFNGINPDDVAVDVADDDTASIVVAPVSLTIAEPDGADSFNMRLTGQPAAPVTVALNALGGECTLGAVSEVVLDDANWNSGVDVIVTVLDDPIRDGDQVCDIVTSSAQSADAAYDGLDPDDVTVTVQDDEMPDITVSPRNLTIAVPDDSDTFTITLSDSPTADVQIGLSTDGDECTLNTVTEAVLDDTNWDTGVEVMVSAADDDLVDGDQPCTVITAAAASSDAAYDGQNPPDVQVTVADDERGVRIIESEEITTVFEEGPTSDTYTIELSTSPSDGETVTVTLLPDAQVTITEIDGAAASSPFEVMFDSTNWDEPVVITVQAIDDALEEESPHPGVIAHTVATTGSTGLYTDVTADDVEAAVFDNDGATILVIPQTLDLAEGGTSMTYAIVLSTAPEAGEIVTITAQPDAQLTITHIDGNPVGSAPFQVTFDDTNWDTSHVFTVVAVDDTMPEPTPHPGEVVHQAESTSAVYRGATAPPLVTHIADNDGAGVWIAPTEYELEIGGAAKDYEIVLTMPPAADETVTITLTPVTYVEITAINGNPATAPFEIIFDVTDWDIPQVITTQAAGEMPESDIKTTIMHTLLAEGSSPVYDGVVAPTVTIHIPGQPPEDDDDDNSNDNNGDDVAENPVIEVFDPAISKIGILLPGQLGLPGEQLIWEITVANTSAVPGYNVVVSDTLIPELHIDQVFSERGTATVSGQTVIFTIGTINPQEVLHFQIVTTVLGSPADGLIANRAELSADNLANIEIGEAVISVPTGLPSTGYVPQERSMSPRLPYGLVVGSILLVFSLVLLGLTLRKRLNI